MMTVQRKVIKIPHTYTATAHDTFIFYITYKRSYRYITTY